MRTIDFTPYRRSAIGFDRLFDLLETSSRLDQWDDHPPYDLERIGEDSYRITLAVAGFRPDEIEITAQPNQLLVSGRKSGEATDDKERYLHRGITARAFERRFQLADFVEVQSANFEDGLLRIGLKRELPEAMKPRRIAIGTTANDRGLLPKLKNRMKAA
ncbi:Hsp20 family protein [Sphingomonas histidinilytica]|uniref:Molecular chaperone IbpA n=1 Tax=Rhizorhabdus histidinilytica TaxID=439228 RepID=A0A1T5H1H8_9SPHN|nr:Hsp20 family protein [Rhizorhabdus histidinilytica]MBO9379864.1 Hsp20 family protein [Rhizorhabdus histidinilytica]SKC14459.1 molecular chaperone IbpA [Rhizorhabdus histidinilytica]